jgi:hypothetical protein
MAAAEFNLMKTTIRPAHSTFLLAAMLSLAFQLPAECRNQENHQALVRCASAHSVEPCHDRPAGLSQCTNCRGAFACGASLNYARSDDRAKSSAVNLDMIGGAAPGPRIVAAPNPFAFGISLKRGHGPPTGRPLFIALHTLLI